MVKLVIEAMRSYLFICWPMTKTVMDNGLVLGKPKIQGMARGFASPMVIRPMAGGNEVVHC